jgi:hypothetical protein
MKCICGAKTNKIRYTNGKMTCDSCVTISLSGTWERNANAERNKYAKDILQRFDSKGNENKEFTKAWGNKNVKREQHKYDSRTSN